MENLDSTWAPQSPDLSAYHSADPEPLHPQHQGYRGSISHSSPYSPISTSPTVFKQPIPLFAMARPVKKEESMPDSDYDPEATDKSTAKLKGKKARVEIAMEEDASTPAPSTEANTEAIVIKNHFPVARIKRIMQADDEVGKVAQVTPVVVSKALELFMISLVTKAAAEAKGRSSKRVTPAHLKQVVVGNEQFDFLAEIVAKVQDAPQQADKDAMDVDGKKRKAPPRKRKAKVEEDDF